jgi:RNA polymerase sigma factor FliA
MSTSRSRQGMKVYQKAATLTADTQLDREALFNKYKRRIYHIAHRIKDRIPPGSTLGFEDLVSYGAIGLFEAVERFDPDRNNQFSTFADYRIRGAMFDALRSLDEMSRHSRDQAKELRDHTEILQQQLGRSPTSSEVASSMEMDIDDFYLLQNKVQSISHVSIDGEQDKNDDTRTLLDVLVDDNETSAMDLLLNEEFREQIRDVISELSDRKRQCVLLYYGRNLNLSEIAEVFDVTPSRISQILNGVRSELRLSLTDIAKDYGYGGNK